MCNNVEYVKLNNKMVAICDYTQVVESTGIILIKVMTKVFIKLFKRCFFIVSGPFPRSIGGREFYNHGG